MKKMIIMMMSLVICLGLIMQPISEKENVEFRKLSEAEQQEIKKNTYYKFSEEELKGTEYEGKKVEIIEGQMYVDDRAIGVTLVYIWYKANWIACAAFTMAGGYQQLYDLIDLTSTTIGYIRSLISRVPSTTEVYLNSNQSINSFKLSNGNECVPTGATTYACKFSV